MVAEKRIGEESMKVACQEERAIAISKRKYHQRVPAITVIVDGGWSKGATNTYTMRSQ